MSRTVPAQGTPNAGGRGGSRDRHGGRGTRYRGGRRGEEAKGEEGIENPPKP